jgi:hypothetical protein
LKAVLVSPVTELSKCVAVGFTHFTVPDPGEEFAERGLSLLLPIKIK